MKKISQGTSARARANRLNAAKSTGPRTAAGKARVSRNAVIHGFAAQAFAAPDLGHDRMAVRIAGPGADETRLALAREIALADEAVRRARRARAALATMVIEPPVTIEGVAERMKELERTLRLLVRVGDYDKMSKKVYKGRPLKIDNYPRFRHLFQKLADVPERLSAFDRSERGEGGPLWAARVRLLDRYEADALRRRKRAIAAFDQFVRSAVGQPNEV